MYIYIYIYRYIYLRIVYTHAKPICVCIINTYASIVYVSSYIHTRLPPLDKRDPYTQLCRKRGSFTLSKESHIHCQQWRIHMKGKKVSYINRQNGPNVHTKKDLYVQTHEINVCWDLCNTPQGAPELSINEFNIYNTQTHTYKQRDLSI